jgi:hypothetical protein
MPIGDIKMTHQILHADTIEASRAIAAQGGIYLVMDASTLQMIEAAEEAGGFEGGMSGSSDGAPYSAEGSGGSRASSAADPAPVEKLDLGRLETIKIEDLVEKVMDAKDAIASFTGEVLGPMIVIPTEELKRWLYGSTDAA